MELKRCYADNVKIKMNLLVDRIMRRIFVFQKAKNSNTWLVSTRNCNTDALTTKTEILNWVQEFHCQHDFSEK